jgi:hypothetical protein
MHRHIRLPLPSRLRFTGAAGHPSDAGVTLVEILVGVVVLATALAMAAVMNGVAGSGLTRSTLFNDRDAAVDADIAEIRELASRYTWCSGQGLFSPPDPRPATCPSRDLGDERYYSPAVLQSEATVADGNPSMRAFQNACADASLNNALITAINARPLPEGLNRVVGQEAVDGIPTNRLLVRYGTQAGDSTPIYRTAVISPTVAAWCP